jgi:g-D-glutamyl-meso-diaminopimelate peptidase
MYMLDQYARAYAGGSTIGSRDVKKALAGCVIDFMPMVNPDGVALSQEGAEVFPVEAQQELIDLNGGDSDFTDWKANAQGVDLNRQYDAGWEIIEGTAPEPGPETYKGATKESAPEVRLVLDFVEASQPRIAVSYHTAGQVVYWDYETGKTQRARDKKIAKAFARLTGYRLVDTPRKAGTGFTDWFTYRLGRPAVTLEICKPTDTDSSPLDEFNAVWKQNKEVGLYAAMKGAHL